MNAVIEGEAVPWTGLLDRQHAVSYLMAPVQDHTHTQPGERGHLRASASPELLAARQKPLVVQDTKHPRMYLTGV